MTVMSESVGETRLMERVAVLVASKDGAATIADTVASARAQADVYVVSDGSSDDTARASRQAGATVLDLSTNVGKPAALHRACQHFGLFARYEFVAILDDDTVIADDFVRQCLRTFAQRPENVIVVGRTISDWPREKRWNPWIAARAYSYWRYQVALRRGQSAVNALNCVSGSNSMYRSSLLRNVLVENNPYIVDDTYWVLETHRRKLGRVSYEPDAHAIIQDPTSMRDWYKQNLRWLWGTFQGIIGHKVGRTRSWFDFWYVGLILDWLLYLFAWPALLIVAITSDRIPALFVLLYMFVGYSIWIGAASIALKRYSLLLFLPFIVVFDWLYRVNFIHAWCKALRHKTVASCTWESPTRYSTDDGRVPQATP